MSLYEEWLQSPWYAKLMCYFATFLVALLIPVSLGMVHIFG